MVGKFTDDNLNLFPKGNVVRRKLCILVNARLMSNEVMVYRGQYMLTKNVDSRPNMIIS